jgi:hypothetical protein
MRTSTRIGTQGWGGFYGWYPQTLTFVIRSQVIHRMVCYGTPPYICMFIDMILGILIYF